MMTIRKVKDVNMVDKRIGEKINYLRLSIGMTRQELAEQIGVTHQQLQKYERGVNRITASRLVDVAKALDTEVVYFLEDSLSPLGTEQVERQRMCVEVMRDFLQIKNPEHQDAVRRLIKVLS